MRLADVLVGHPAPHVRRKAAQDLGQVLVEERQHLRVANESVVPLLVTPGRRDQGAVQHEDLHLPMLAQELRELAEVDGVARVSAVLLPLEGIRVVAARRPALPVLLPKRPGAPLKEHVRALGVCGVDAHGSKQLGELCSALAGRRLHEDLAEGSPPGERALAVPPHGGVEEHGHEAVVSGALHTCYVDDLELVAASASFVFRSLTEQGSLDLVAEGGVEVVHLPSQPHAHLHAVGGHHRRGGKAPVHICVALEEIDLLAHGCLLGDLRILVYEECGLALSLPG
mmetsp:Transcript_47254/g.145530  ORF Transcript_47254/g.145530 Transcript_47254/m.145530 type:complete len:284 (-) Transcript_47254:225-1076(-)